jgi:hypothetical protein
MARFVLRMKYDTPVASGCMHVLAVLFPIWGIAMPITLLLFTWLLVALPANIALSYSAAIIAGLLAVMLASMLAAVVCDDNEIRVDKNGIVFPLRFVPALKGKFERTWDELKAIRIRWLRNSQFSADEYIALIFADGAAAVLKLPYLKKSELEQFFIAFESCAYNCQRDAELADFERAVEEPRDGHICSYTQMWEQTLSQRFAPSTFIPREPNAPLQDGRYQILKQLAFGGFSAVYLARCRQRGFVVIKECVVPDSHSEIATKAAEMFSREAQLLRGISHEHIVAVVDHFTEEGRQYLVLEHVEGIDLQQLVYRNGVQPTATVRLWLRQLADALEYLHGQSPPLVHRDLTPDNIVLKPDGTLVIVDFGAAKELASSFTGTIIGKQFYMPPEQIQGKATAASDIYSLGGTLHYLLTGKQPQPLCPSKPSSVLPDIDPLLDEIVVACTNPDPSLRPTASQLLEMLEPSAAEPVDVPHMVPAQEPALMEAQ